MGVMDARFEPLGLGGCSSSQAEMSTRRVESSRGETRRGEAAFWLYMARRDRLLTHLVRNESESPTRRGESVGSSTRLTLRGSPSPQIYPLRGK